MKKNKYLYFFFLILLISCKSTIFDLRNEIPTNEKIMEDLKNKRIIFIGENHNDVYPIIFLTEYIQDFYNAGLRYLFLEGSNPRLKESYKEDDYAFVIMNPIIQMTWKYEENALVNKILEINKNNPEDKINIFFPEENIIEFEHYTVKEQLLWLNYRDKIAQEKIISILNNTSQKDKAIIFYGSSHGNKKIQKDDNSIDLWWKPMGVYLDNYFGENFSNYVIVQPSYNKDTKVIFSEQDDCVCLSKEYKECILKNDTKLVESFDNICLASKLIAGVPYSYVPTRENLNYLLKCAKENLKNKEMIKKDNSSFSKVYIKEEFVLVNYYLKYLFGQYFDYNLCESEKNMEKALYNLEIHCFSGNKNPCDYVQVNYSLHELENYMYYLFCNGAIEWYLKVADSEQTQKEDRENCIQYVIDNMIKANQLNNKDLFPLYWFCYFITEKAILSDKKEDFITAINSWVKVLDIDLLYASPMLEIVYQKLSFCYEKIDDYESKNIYDLKLLDIRDEVEFDYEFYKNFGY